MTPTVIVVTMQFHAQVHEQLGLVASPQGCSCLACKACSAQRAALSASHGRLVCDTACHGTCASYQSIHICRLTNIVLLLQHCHGRQPCNACSRCRSCMSTWGICQILYRWCGVWAKTRIPSCILTLSMYHTLVAVPS